MERWETSPSEKNAIERVMEEESYIAWLGKDYANRLKQRMLKRHFLDRKNDQPLPKWATDIFYDFTLGFRRRIRVVMFHNFDILNEDPRKYRPGWDNKESPQWLTEFRMKKLEEARKLIAKKKQEGTL